MRALALCALLGGGCPPAPDTGESAPPGPWDRPWPVIVTVDGQALAEGSFAGLGPLWWVLDTGAARTFVDAALTNEGTGDVTVGPITLDDVQVGLVDLSEAEAFIGWDLGGLAGQDFFDDRVVVIDYGASQAHYLDTLPEEPPPGALAEDVGFLTYGLPSSIPVAPVTAAGLGEATVDLVADTGSGVTILTQSTFEAIDDGSLPRLEGYVWASNYGSDEAFVTRVPRLEAGGAVAEGTWAVVVPDDHHLKVILEAVGVSSQGFLGYPFYRRFLTGVDGWERAYRFWPSADLSHEDPDEWHRAGIEPSWRDGGFTVEMVFSPSSAASAGVQRGDRIVGLGALDLASTTADEVKRALRGPVGGSVHVSLDRGGTAVDIDLTFQDLLPEI